MDRPDLTPIIRQIDGQCSECEQLRHLLDDYSNRYDQLRATNAGWMRWVNEATIREGVYRNAIRELKYTSRVYAISLTISWVFIAIIVVWNMVN